MKCPKCGALIADNDLYCPKCGMKIAQNDTTVSGLGHNFSSDGKQTGNNPTPTPTNNGGTPAKPVRMGSIIAMIVIAALALGCGGFAAYASFRSVLDKTFPLKDLYSALGLALGFLGILFGVIAFGRANKWGREQQPHKKLQILIVILGAFALAFGVMALTFQGIYIVAY